MCRSGIRKINLPGNIIKIDYFFQNCKNLEEINFSANQKELIIPQCVFTGCRSLKSLTFPASVQSVTILPSLYADDQKEEGVETLIFLGKNTRLHCINDNDEEIPDYIPAGKIVAPKDSLAIHKAKNSKKISAFTTLEKKRIAEDVEYVVIRWGRKMTKKEEQYEMRKNQILDISLNHFIRYGFYGTSTRKIAEEAGIRCYSRRRSTDTFRIIL